MHEAETMHIAPSAAANHFVPFVYDIKDFLTHFSVKKLRLQIVPASRSPPGQMQGCGVVQRRQRVCSQANPASTVSTSVCDAAKMRVSPPEQKWVAARARAMPFFFRPGLRTQSPHPASERSNCAGF